MWLASYFTIVLYQISTNQTDYTMLKSTCKKALYYIFVHVFSNKLHLVSDEHSLYFLHSYNFTEYSVLAKKVLN